MPHETFTQAILSSDFGKMLGEEVCREIIRLSETRRYPNDSVIFQEGDAAEGIFLVSKGIVKLVRISEDGRENVIHFVEPPGLFAEAAVFMGKYPVTAITLADTELLFLRKDAVLELAGKHATFLNFLFSTMARWLQRLVNKIDQLTLNDGTARLVRYLFGQFEKEDAPADYKIPRVILPSKKGDLATLLNMNQPSLSRIFRKLQDDKLIVVEGRTIYLNDLPALRKLTLPPLD
jgi:CRP/FNR family transcriptional regulator, dissimilatory nitrate respiration regulator